MPLNKLTRRTVGASVSNLVIISGKFQVGASGAITAGTQQGKMFTPVRTSTGLYTITLTGVGAVNIIHADAGVIEDSATPTTATRLRKADNATRIVQVQCGANASPQTAADPPSGSWVTFVAHVNCNSKNW